MVAVRTTLCLGLMAGLLLSLHLWAGPRLYPLTPLLAVYPLGYPAVGVLIGLLGLIIVISRPPFIYGFLALALLFALADQSRWQPWFYQYLFMLAAVALNRKDACRLMIVCIYFWSGIQKLNPGFINDTFAWMAGPLAHFVPAFTAPLAESLIGIGLLTRRFRTVAVCAAIAMHLFILVSIGPLGHNSNHVVWPWNIVMCALVIQLFWQAPDVVWAQKGLFPKVVLLMFGILPALSFADLWDSYLSFALYSGNQRKAVIYMADSVADRMPDKLQEFIDVNDSKVDTLDIDDWSFGELNVPPYAETRIYLNVAKQVCAYAGNSPHLVMIVKGKRSWFHPQSSTRFSCSS